MKKIALVTLIIFLNINSYSQNFKDLYNRLDKFDKQEQYDNVDKEILKAVDYLLSHQYKEKTESYFYALKSMIKRMNGTSNYAIIIGGKIGDDIGKDTLLLNMYMASMAKYLLVEHLEKDRYIIPKRVEGKKFTDLDEVREIMFEGGKIFLDYLENESKLKPNKKLNKALKSYKKEKLYEYMFDK